MGALNIDRSFSWHVSMVDRERMYSVSNRPCSGSRRRSATLVNAAPARGLYVFSRQQPLWSAILGLQRHGALVQS
jgi:hypothetical protein